MLVRVSSMRGTSHDLDLCLLHQALVAVKQYHDECVRPRLQCARSVQVTPLARAVSELRVSSEAGTASAVAIAVSTSVRSTRR